MVYHSEEQRWTRSKYPLQANPPGSAQARNVASHSGDPKDAVTKQLPNSAQAPTRLEVHHSASTVENEQLNSSVSQRTNDSGYYSPHLSHDSQVDSVAPALDSVSTHSTSSGSAPITEYHMATTTSPADDQGKSSPNIDLPGERKLRRTPRSRRIEARVSLADIDEAQDPSHTSKRISNTDIEEATAVPKPDSQWQAREQHASYTQTMSDNKASSESALPHGSEKNKSVQPRNSTNNEGKTINEEHKEWTRGAYPLQRPASHANLGLSSTTPLSSTKQQSASISHENPSLSPNSRSVKQTPASASGHQYPIQAATSSSHAAAEQEMPPKTPAQPVSQPSSTSTHTKNHHRQRYPLQSPASIADLHQHQTGSNQIHESTASQPKADGKTRSNQSVRRSKYPLQSPASVANLQQPSTSSKVLQSNATAQVEEQSRTLAKSKEHHRGVYPLQSPASQANLRHLSTLNTQSVVSSAQSKDNHASDPTNPGFRRHKYPLQLSTQSVPVQRHRSQSSTSTVVGGSWSEDESSEQPPPPAYLPEKSDAGPGSDPTQLLPKNIRAVEDSQKPLKGRTIVVCLDGTGDKFDDDNSNIVHLVSALKKDDSQQVTYYQAGIGTYNDGGLSSGAAAAMDMAVGSGLGLHIRDAYHFLMHSYKEGDRICIFGFSRGAYTARCLAGMIHKVGLLPPRNIQQIQFAYDFYKKDTAEGWRQSEDFKRAFSIEVNVHFLGCFDSVSSVGFIPRQLPLSSTPGSKARYFRHAMALDERRAKFKICRYQSAKKQGQLEKVATPTEDESDASKALDLISNSKSQKDTPSRFLSDLPYGKENHPNISQAEYERLNSHEDDFDTDVLEVWFAGCHADVGGGAVANQERHKLAQIPLRWMIRQAFECNTGIIFKTKFLAEYGVDIHTLWPKYRRLDIPPSPPTTFLNKYVDNLPPRSVRRSKLMPIGKREREKYQHHHHDPDEPLFVLNSPTDEDWTPEQVEDYYDAMSPMNDQLVQAPGWWILEVMPVQYKVSNRPGEVLTLTGPNMGLSRLVEDYEANIHWTVLQRAQQLDYKAYARPAMHTEWRVVA